MIHVKAVRAGGGLTLAHELEGYLRKLEGSGVSVVAVIDNGAYRSENYFLVVCRDSPEEKAINYLNEGIELAWGLIANAGEGDWTTQTTEWQEAAAKWRDTYMLAGNPSAD